MAKAMQEPIVTLRPSITYVIVGYIYTLLMFLSLVLVLVAAKAEVLNSSTRLMLVMGIFLIAPTRQAIRSFQARTTISLDEIQHDYGGKNMKRQLFLSQVERIHVEQGLLQRISGCGTIYIKKFDEITRLTLEHMDDPHKLADFILARARA